jgi:hypothetical protein
MNTDYLADAFRRAVNEAVEEIEINYDRLVQRIDYQDLVEALDVDASSIAEHIDPDTLASELDVEDTLRTIVEDNAPTYVDDWFGENEYVVDDVVGRVLAAKPRFKQRVVAWFKRQWGRVKQRFKRA